MTRRTFLRAGAGSAVALATPAITFSQGSAAVKASLAIEENQVIASVPENFTGLSYESAQLAHPDFFASSNTALVKLVRTLGSRGVLRIGGNTSEYMIWSPQGAPAAAEGAVGPDTGHKAPRQFHVTPEAIRNLAGFMEAVDWKLIFGLNLGTGKSEHVAQQAKAVSGAVGDRLLEFQIGNEPDLFHRNGLRPPDWKFSDYFAQWKQFAAAVRRAVPHARLAAPDVAYNVRWIVDFAQQGKDEIVELTGHYYAEGPPTNPAMNIERLLHPNNRLDRDIPIIQRASHESGKPYRMAETNSCYQGGKAGVSDTFASALWGGDYMLQLEQAGFAGINFHGGGEGYYTPIAGSEKHGFSARPLYYGMLLAEQFAGTKIVKSTLDAQGVNATAYAAIGGSGPRVAVFNKDEQHAMRVRVKHAGHGRLWRLSAPSVRSKTDVTLAGAAVSDGKWSPAREEPVSAHRGSIMIDIPAASAVLLLL